MPGGDPGVVGESQTVPGAWDVRGADGVVRPVDPRVAQGMGLSLPSTGSAEGDAVLQSWMIPQGGEAQEAPFNPMNLPMDATAPAPVDDGGAVAPAPASPANPQDRASLQQWHREAMDHREAPARQAEQAQQERDDMFRWIAAGVARDDQRAGNMLADLIAKGDPDAIELGRQLDRRRRAGLLGGGGGGGGGGSRTTQTATTRFAGPGRAPTPEEAQRMAALRKEQDDIERDQLVGIAAEIDAEAHAQEQAARQIAAANDRMARLEEQQRQAEAVRQAELNRRGQELDRLAQVAAEGKLEPGRVLAKGQTSARLSAAMGLLLGGLGDAFTGGNAGLQTALSIIDKAINDDIDAQKHALAGKRQDVSTAQSLLGQARARFGDAKAAEAAAKDAILSQVERQLQAIGRTQASETAQAKLRQLASSLEAQRNALRQQALQSGLGTRELVIQEQQRAGGGGGRRPLNIGELLPEEAEVSGEERERLADRRQNLETTIQEADRALELLESTSLTGPLGSRVPLATSQDARELERTLKRVATPLATAAFGALGNEEQLDLVADQNGLNISNRADDIRSNLLRIREEARSKLEAAELGVSEQAVQERRERAPGVRRRVTVEDGRIEDIAPSARREVRR